MLCSCIKIFIGIFIITISYIIGMYMFFPKDILYKYDILNYTVFKINDVSYSLWPVSHFLLYFIIGLFCRDHWVFILFIGVLWEFFEYVFGNILYQNDFIEENEDGIVSFYKDKNIHTIKSKNQYNKKWLTFNKTDIVFNTLGYISGLIVSCVINNTV